MPKTHFSPVGGNKWNALASFYDELRAHGNVYWVNSVTGNNTTATGLSPEDPFASIAYAIGKCVANNNDLILVMAGHVETVIAAGTVNVNVAGVTIRGIGTGRQRGTVNYTTAAAASFNITAAGVTVQNLTFTGMGVAAVTSMVNVSAADCSILGCEFEHANATNQAGIVISSTAAANRLIIDSCSFHGSNNAGTTSALSIVGGDAARVSNCRFSGAYHVSAGVILNQTTACTNIAIVNNYIQNLTASNTKSVVLVAASTGQISDNNCQILSGTAPFTAAAGSWVGCNYYAATIATAGTLI